MTLGGLLFKILSVSQKLPGLWFSLFSWHHQLPLTCLPPKFTVFKNALRVELLHTVAKKVIFLGKSFRALCSYSLPHPLGKFSEPWLCRCRQAVAHFLAVMLFVLGGCGAAGLTGFASPSAWNLSLMSKGASCPSILFCCVRDRAVPYVLGLRGGRELLVSWSHCLEFISICSQQLCGLKNAGGLPLLGRILQPLTWS